MLVQPYYDQIVQNIRPALVALSVAVTFVLLIGCANLANLMLARGEARQREIAIREALGATRWRLFQQLLTESVLMSLGGGALGCLAGVVERAGLRRVAAPPRCRESIRSPSICACWRSRMLVSVATGLAFGLAPALRAASSDLLTSLEGRGARHARSRVADRASALVVGEVALALVLLVGAGLTIRSFATLTAVDLGFDPSHVVTMHVVAPRPRLSAMSLDGSRFIASCSDACRRFRVSRPSG